MIRQEGNRTVISSGETSGQETKKRPWKRFPEARVGFWFFAGVSMRKDLKLAARFEPR